MKVPLLQLRKNLRSLEKGLLIPVRNLVILPGITLPIVVGRPRSLAVALSAMTDENKELIIAAVKPERTEDKEDKEINSLEQIYTTATLAKVVKSIRLPGGPIQLIIEGKERVKIGKLLPDTSTYSVEFERLPLVTKELATKQGIDLQTIEALSGAIKSLWGESATINPNFPEELLQLLLYGQDPAQLAYQTSVLLQQNVAQMQALLEEDNLEVLLRKILASLQEEIKVLRLRSEILGETKKEIEAKQREFMLREQLKKIQAELGETDPQDRELEELKSRLETAKLPETAEKQALRELSRLERIGSLSAEGGVIRTYLDWLLEMPWNDTVEDNLALVRAREILDEDHYGLDRIKDRIVEHLATFKLRKQQQEERSPDLSIGTVICFVGPPGVGKTSLGRSIARALGRPFERISLGGLRDEAELRGHRRTYIGAMPGRIIQALHRAKVLNPVIMLDELDKIGMDYRGDPASVLLEILDPQQNHSFRDLYLDLNFDLSRVMFIGTANDLSRIPPSLLDRLEIVEMSGYATLEKLAIAREYLLPRQIEKAGLPSDAIVLARSTLLEIVQCYTKEAGVRKLEQQLGALCRKVAVRYANDETEPAIVNSEDLDNLLGSRPYLPQLKNQITKPGVATGLAWTVAGGEVLFVEAVLLPRGKDLILTGQLGKVMQESAQIARSYIWSHARELEIDLDSFTNNGLHVHVPGGAIPKDGPSAGITTLVAIASLLTGRSVRTDTAMTGEINLSGQVLPVGGLREKLLAAARAGIDRILLPSQNQKDLVDLPEETLSAIEPIFCDNVEEVLELALISK